MALMSKLVLASAVASTAAFAPSSSARASTALAARQPIIAGNWKLNPPTVEDANALAKAVAELMGDETCAVDGDGDMCTEVVVFPPYPFLGSVVEDLADVGIGVGAQSVFAEAESGAFTGAVSTAMVESMGCEYVLCGHSERRTVFKDDDAAVNKKVLRVYEDGLKPVLCIGETKEEYEAGLCEDVCKVQLAKDLAGVSKEQAMDLVIAYEPVWAIGTGLVCPSDVAQSVHKTVRAFLAELYDQAVADAVRIQYGGSVTPESVDELMSMPDIDGCLVGGASLVAEKFARICNYVRA
ncbi:triosephosphate isomerase [Aureococcus anophagefferens]|uniref:Triosephosphate isomerase n=2 Tax=Aureococcus anophagefferens TaxID=44056 RepID=A0ABR1GAZ9_AURAN